MDWDSRYRAGELGPSEPHRLVVEAAKLLPPGRALDLASGGGRNARYLAQLGWNVIAVDASAVALQLIHRSHKGSHKVLADLERDPLPFRDGLFDMIMIINFLHRPLFAEALRAARSGGVIAAAVRTAGNYSMPPNELRGYFADCKIVVDRAGEIIAIKGGAA